MSTPDGTEDRARREAPVMPTAAEVEAAGEGRPPAPRPVRAAFWVFLAAGVVGLVGSVLFFALRDEWAEVQIRSSQGRDLPDMHETAKGLSWWLLVGSVMFLAFFALLAHAARRGERKARTLLVVLSVFAALFEYTIGRVTIYGLVAALLIIIGVVLLYLPGSRAFFAVDDEV
ncbi:hypothetical protein [Actinokineospora bangkokensis]|uniref:Uncharacterized protein n=1 Tax=Actinokineospora bangkokensis TaxID=1193682 RepID=A0A1Q9LFD9_9PSEU|nr:hypothetical protein [Actinokineospora bangkokensis]OLR90738.1 hypothetical protein BJP25_29545 [Actinokineospora bangkokensis]